ncbi:acetyl-mannosamine transferase [Clostridia bacterium]|nr:acetyl-mannosamine transferase [Clostridia bacterium]
MQKVPLLNTKVSNMTMKEMLNQILQYIRQKKKAYVVAVNVDVMVKIEKDRKLKQIVDKADLVCADGMPLLWVSHFLYHRKIKEKISGSDLVPKLCQKAAQCGYSLFILGGKPGVAQRAKRNLERMYPGLHVVGTYAPPFHFEQDSKEIQRINKKISQVQPDILLVCLGCPKQEKFVSQNIGQYQATVSLCAGATVDFLAGRVKRAPQWMSKSGLEWFYRFLQEPRRLFKRYFIEDMQILKLIGKYRGQRNGK